MNVLIKGRGVAATACAHLLRRSGIAAAMPDLHPTRGSGPAVLLSMPALALLRETFGKEDLFADKPRIGRRIVAWGGSEPVAVPHDALVLGAGELDKELQAFGGNPVADEAADFSIHAAPRDAQASQHVFGNRQAVAVPVELLHLDDQQACWIEAVDDGWIFMIPSAAAGNGWLLAVGGELPDLLDQSRHLARRIAVTGGTAASFQISPRILDTRIGVDWLACGTSTIAFDPICGDGTAMAAREAILASAVVAAMRDGEDAASLLGHYDAMLVAAMRRHLRLCMQFYANGGQSPWWRSQLEAMIAGFEWCTEHLAAVPEPRYELRDFRLMAREAAA